MTQQSRIVWQTGRRTNTAICQNCHWKSIGPHDPLATDHLEENPTHVVEVTYEQWMRVTYQLVVSDRATPEACPVPDIPVGLPSSPTTAGLPHHSRAGD